MVDRPADLQAVQFGVEVTPGTAVAASRRLLAVEAGSPFVQPSSAAENRPVGTKFAVAAIPGTEFVEMAFDAQCDYGNLPYLLNGVLGAVSDPAAGAQGERSRLWTPSRLGGVDVPKTYTIEHGSADRAERFDNAFIPDLTLSISPQATRITGRFIGKDYTDPVTLTATPTEPEYVPAPFDDWTFYLDTTPGGIGGTALTRGFAAVLAITNRWAPSYPVNAALARGFVGPVEKAGVYELTLTLEADAVGMGLLAAIRTGAFRYGRLEAVGPVIGGAVNYKITIDLALLPKTFPAFGAQDDVVVLPFVFSLGYDSTLTKALSWQVIDKLAAAT